MSDEKIRKAAYLWVADAIEDCLAGTEPAVLVGIPNEETRGSFERAAKLRTEVERIRDVLYAAAAVPALPPTPPEFVTVKLLDGDGNEIKLNSHIADFLSEESKG